MAQAVAAATFPILPHLSLNDLVRPRPTRWEFFTLDLRGQIATIGTGTDGVRAGRAVEIFSVARSTVGTHPAGSRAKPNTKRTMLMSIGLILLIILILILLGGVGPSFYSGAPWRYGYGYGHGGIGIVGVIVIILVVLLLMGRL